MTMAIYFYFALVKLLRFHIFFRGIGFTTWTHAGKGTSVSIFLAWNTPVKQAAGNAVI